MTGPEVRYHVTGWRWDLLGPGGWIKPLIMLGPDGGDWIDPKTVMLTFLDGPQATQLGWFVEEKARCLDYEGMGTPAGLVTAVLGHPKPRHQAPNPACSCGLHAIEFVSHEAVGHIADLVTGRGKRRDQAVVLSQVDLFTVLPGVPTSAKAIAAGAAANPPGTIRAARKRYTHLYLDREHLTVRARLKLGVAATYVPDLVTFACELADQAAATP